MTRAFHIGDVLSITTGVLVSPRGVEGVYDILGHMTGESLFTHQLPRAATVCGPALLRQHPRLPTDADRRDGETWDGWVARMAAEHGAELVVSPLAAGEYAARNPVAELVEMVGPEKVVVVTTEG
jgi:hypothetical protein